MESNRKEDIVVRERNLVIETQKYNPNELLSTLVYIKQKFGLELFFDAHKLNAIVLDLSPQLGREIKIIKRIIETGLLEELKQKNIDSQKEKIIFAKIQHWMVEEEYIQAEKATQYVWILKKVFACTENVEEGESQKENISVESTLRNEKIADRDNAIHLINALSLLEKKQENEDNWKDEKQQEKRNVIRYRIIYICIAVIATISLIGWRNSVNTQALQIIQKSILGQTYSDEKGVGHFSGEEYESIVVNIIDEKQLEYIHGEYIDIVSEGASGYNLTKKENEIYKRCTYDYELSISFLGNITITIDGKDYKVTLNDDNTISRIHFYED